VTNLVAALTAAVPGARIEAASATTASDGQPTLFVHRDDLVAVARVLHDTPELAFSVLLDVVGIDRLPAEPRYEVAYNLLSPSQPAHLRLKVQLPAADPRVATVQGIWPGANWLERETWDLMGITFDGHQDLRRLLTPEDWEGHPLRKDYPVQIRLTPRSTEALQVTEEEFQANLSEDRRARARGGAPAARPNRGL
jgi:NADH-quinone oxidoreductase subunit C